MRLFVKTKEGEIEGVDPKFEIITHKKATKKQVNKVKKANDVLNNLFVDNNFTVKLVLAAKKH